MIRRLVAAPLVLACAVFAAGCGSNSTGPGTPPTLTGVTPPIGTIGTELVLTGANFRAGASVYLDSAAADSVKVVNTTTVYATVPAGVVANHAYAVKIKNSDGTSASLAAAFTPVLPILQYVNGATLPSGNVGSTVIIEGQAFGDHEGTGQVLFSDGVGGTVSATIASSGDWTNTFIVTTVPAGAATGPIKVQTGLGTSDTLKFTVTANATFSPSTIAWTATDSLPIGLSGHAAVLANVAGANWVYVIGGADSTGADRAEVYRAQVDSLGALGTWSTTTALPAAIAFHAAVAATPANSRVKGWGYIYVLGGATDTAGTPTATIYRGTLDSAGAVTGWTTLSATLPAAAHSLGAVVFRGDLFIAGGSGASNAPLATVYRARIDSTGALGAWQAEASLPYARSYAGFRQFGEYLYVFGGDSGAVSPNNASATTGTKVSQIAYAKLDLHTDDIIGTSWTANSGSLTKAVSKHTATLLGGTVLISGGLYNGAATGSSEESYAQLNADGTVGSLNGATGSHTIASAGGGNIFNQASLAYVDAAGVAHVLIIGGDDVNTPGAKHRQVWYY